MIAASRITQDRVPALLKSIRQLSDNHVLVGIPAEKADRDGPGEDGSVNNAMIGYINEFGSPAMNIPARPHLFPGVRSVKNDIVQRLKAAARVAILGSQLRVLQAQHTIGLVCQNAVRGKITEGLSPALSPKTLYNRKNRKIAPRMGEMPLIDKGIYRRSITYVIRPREE